jgi:peptidoglycan/LPS O-acetylase OafA/YrhL
LLFVVGLLGARGDGGVVRRERRWDIDWLRVLAVLLLFPFHTARIFDFARFYVEDAVELRVFWFFEALVDPWHMPLFFLLAGASTWFALRFRSGGQYVRERFVRLLVPFLFGLFVLVPPQSYFGLRNHSCYAESFVEYYPRFFRLIPEDLDGYFLGGFTLAHLWFVLYLFVFSLVGLPLFLYLRGESGRRLVDRLGGFFSRPGAIFLLGVVPYVLGRLVDFNPDPFYYLAFFVCGFLLMADGRFEESIVRYRRVGLFFGPVLHFVVWVGVWWLISGGVASLVPAWVWGLLEYQWFLSSWCFLVALLGYGRRFLSFSSGFLRYFGEAAYPLYILHQTVIVVIGYYVVRWELNVFVKFGVILVAGTAVTILLYDLLVKRSNVTRFLFGMRLKK